MSSPVSYLADELKQNGILIDAPEISQHPAVLTELSYALSPVVHEGKLQPYGFIVVSNRKASTVKTTCDKLFIGLPDARRVADGCYSFSIFKDGQFQGVFMPKYAAYTELQLVQLQQELNAIICTTETSGITKLFCDAGVFLHQYRTWQKKPSVTSALESICRCAPQANADTLRDLLEFCFHDLSPRKIGATLVWCLADPKVTELETMKPNFSLQKIETRVSSNPPGTGNAARSVSVLRHLLNYSDGAAILDAQAKAIGVGAQLKYSDTSKRFIEAQAGTRHTSAQRFSYDFAKGIVFVVSSDGPVTVFSDGMSVTDLKVGYADRPAAETAQAAELEASELSPCSSEITCPQCKKRLQIQEIDGTEVNKQEKFLYCPVCNYFIHSARCNNLKVYVLKDWQHC